MLPADERLRRASAFQRAYSARKSISTPIITLYVVPRIKETHRRGIAQLRMPFVGFVVAKKVCKSAVARNRSKRRVREAYRLLTQSNRLARAQAEAQNEAIVREEALKLDQWYVLVWVLHSNILAASWDEIKNAVSECLRKAESKFGRQKPRQVDGDSQTSNRAHGKSVK